MQAAVRWHGLRWEFPDPLEGWQSRLMWLLITATLVLNLVDGAATLLWVELGVAEEANLLLRDLVEVRPVRFMLVKLSLVSLGLALLWRYRNHGLALGGVLLCFAAYSLLFLVHINIARLCTAV